MRPKPHHVEIDDGDPNEIFVCVMLIDENGDHVETVEMYRIEQRAMAYDMAHRLASALDMPLTLIDGWGNEPKLIPVKHPVKA